MLISAKFASKCSVCSREVQPGDRISWAKGSRTVAHAACSAEGQALVAATAESRATDLPETFTGELPVPAGLSYLPYQRAGIAYAIPRKGTLIADEMGLGKTIQAIGVINASPEINRVLIVCPASVKLNWQAECRKWLTRALHVGMFGLFNGDGADCAIQIINWDVLGKVPDGSWDLVVFDEAHRAKNPKAARSKHAQRIARAAKKVLCLTGTPIEAKPIELFPILQMVAPAEWDPAGVVKGVCVGAGAGAGFFRYAKRYCAAHKEQVSRTKSVWMFDGTSNTSELQEKLRATCMVRRLKKDVLTELPPKRRQVIEIEGTCGTFDDDADLDERNYDEFVRRVRSNKIAFEDISRVRHADAVAKIPAVLEHLEESLESSPKVIVFAHHKDVIGGLANGLDALGVGYVTLTGDTTMADRQAAVNAFQTDPTVRVFIGSLTAAGVGITLTAASHVVFAELDWTPGNMSQCEDRAHRIGQRESVLVQHLVIRGSIDARIANILTSKQAVLDAVLDAETIPDMSGRPLVEAPVGRAGHEKDCVSEHGEGTPCLILPPAEVQRIHTALRTLAGMCDGAVQEDGAGFNKFDAAFGHDLAGRESLSPRQALAARKMLRKYSRQIGDLS
jgi:SWI/SNF-related matrix-associated actin-dependent regulator 1 of chromatin subfamily A